MSDMMSDVAKTPREELECKKKYLYEHSMFWECNNGSKCQILEEGVCDLLNKLYEENEQLKEELNNLKKDETMLYHYYTLARYGGDGV